jgi:sialate O-acetylesterase
LAANPDFGPILERSKVFKTNKDGRGEPNQASVLFNGMINPLVPYGIRGAIWYQGESNRSRALQYRTLFPAMITDWRKQFGQGDFPFGFVQLAPYKYVRNDNPADPGKVELAEIWESQTATLKLPHTGMAVTTDIAHLTDIHPKNKQDVGLRLGLWALGTVYKTLGEDPTAFTSPLPASHAVEGKTIRVKFANANGGLVAKDGKALTFFQICGEDKKFVDAEAKIEGDSVVVSAAGVEKPVAVRFAWHETAEPNLFNKTGLPASPFRTDDFPLVTADRK